MANIFTTRRIREELDLRNLACVVGTILRNENKEDIDDLQIFNLQETTMINKQEVPERIEQIPLGYKNNQKCSVWAVKSIDPTYGEVWTIMYPSEY
ncbi:MULTISPECIES: hypothetical protein [Fusobacterium]|uniref:hypothetical protein n=1 Tax=Fusobacterium TaxID=848 RepID=UPI001476EC54|nr:MULTISPECIES: hypothetical protein [Fusobacterium]NME35598.1 hypothetical protein [Fusobacterium sp. FSA-380-WT-3A]